MTDIAAVIACQDADRIAGAPTHPEDPDAALVAQLRARCEPAFEVLVRRYTPRLLTVARRFLRSEEDCADAVQDAFLQAFRSIGTFAGKSRLSTWLFRIAVNASLARVRSRARKSTIPLDDLLPPSGEACGTRAPRVAESCVSRLAAAETREQVRACIDRLPEAYRTVLVLRDLQELDTDQTARALGATRAVVKTRLHRARRALRTLLEPLLLRGAGPSAAVVRLSSSGR